MRYEGLFATINNAASPGSPLSGTYSQRAGRDTNLFYDDPAATLEDLREAVSTFENTERIARRTLGATHPTTRGIVTGLRYARAALRARETPSSGEV